MKSEETTRDPLVDFTKFTSGKGKELTDTITHVLLNDGKWYDIVPDTFHLYKTKDSVPFVQFETFIFDPASKEQVARLVQVFPATVAGWASEID